VNQNSSAFGYIAVLTSAITSLLIVCAALLSMIRRAPQPRQRRLASTNDRRLVSAGIASHLNQVLDTAIALNSYNVGRREMQSIHLANAVRYSPTDFEVARREVADSYKQQRVVSLDLSDIDARSAARLIDFCSGLLAAKPGWLFRLSESVVVLAPGSD
jgi:FtsZ-interacting cell division protein YlmF